MSRFRLDFANLVLVAAPILLLVLVAITYREAPNNVFHFDDADNIYRHSPIMVEELTVENLLDAGSGAWLPRRPLPSITFAIDWWRGGGSPRAFQWTNIAIHAAAAVAVFCLLVLVLQRSLASRSTAAVSAFVGAAIWACHPIQIQSVTYVVQRMTSMAALFTLLTVILYILGRLSRPGRGYLYFALSGLFWILGLVSKETAAVAPFLVLLAEYGVIRHGRTLALSRIDVALIAIPPVLALLVVADLASGAGPLSGVFLAGYELRDFTLAERLLTQPRVIGFHLSQFLWPLPGRFSLEHDFALSTGLLSPVSTLPGILAVVAWTAVGGWMIFRRRLRVVGFFALWFPAALVIESSFIPLEIIFEHRMYLPSVALAGLLALAVGAMLQFLPRFAPLLLVGSTFVVFLLVIASSQRVPEWRSQVVLNESTVRNAPNSARAWAQLAAALRQEGYGWDSVVPPMTRALALDPGQRTALNLRALQLIEQHRLDEADAILGSIELHATIDHSIWNTIGLLRFEQGNFPEAIEQFEKVVAADGFVPEFQYNLALSYEYGGRCAEAFAMWRSLSESGENERLQMSVSRRLLKNFRTPGGRCFGHY